MQLCLGTVQFGMDYGIFNQSKKDPDYCIQCLDYATQNGISAIDTAAAYGIAEQLTGNFLARRTVPREQLFISTKALPNLLDNCDESNYDRVILDNIENSLKALHTDYVDVYFLHSSRYAFRPEILKALYTVKDKGLARNVGVSVYDPDEAWACCSSPFVNYIQIPYSIFDHRMKESDIFDRADFSGCNMDVRTAFVKGLIRLRDTEVPEYLAKAKPILKKLDRLCEETGFSRIDIAMGYIKREKQVNHLVFGIRTLDQLKEDIASFQKNIPESIFKAIDKEFSGIDADIVVPSLWKK